MSNTLRTLLVGVAVLGVASLAAALPVELKDSQGTNYKIATQVAPLLDDSLASGAVTNATFTQPVTVTNYFTVFTFFGGTSTFTTQFQVHVPLQPAFVGFNGLLITSMNGVNLPSPVVFNPAAALAGQECEENGKNRQLDFASQAFPQLNLTLTRKVFVPSNEEWVRWLNIVTNTGPAAVQVGI